MRCTTQPSRMLRSKCALFEWSSVELSADASVGRYCCSVVLLLSPTHDHACRGPVKDANIRFDNRRRAAIIETDSQLEFAAAHSDVAVLRQPFNVVIL
jgi:hypothetical protein